MMLRAAQARAVLLGRSFVVPDDIQAVAIPVMAHRMSPRNISASTADIASIVSEIIDRTKVPV